MQQKYIRLFFHRSVSKHFPKKFWIKGTDQGGKCGEERSVYHLDHSIASYTQFYELQADVRIEY